MAEYYADDKAREQRLAAIRARRGTAERDAAIAEIAERKAQAKKAASTRKSSGSSARKTRENSTEYHGHSWDEWDQMRDIGLALLTARAAKRDYTSYTELWEHISNELGKSLGTSYLQMPSLLEHMTLKGLEDSDLMVTALVTHESAEPSLGHGFFRIAAQKGYLAAADAPGAVKGWVMTEAQRSFWLSQVDALFEKFASNATPVA